MLVNWVFRTTMPCRTCGADVDRVQRELDRRREGAVRG